MSEVETELAYKTKIFVNNWYHSEGLKISFNKNKIEQCTKPECLIIIEYELFCNNIHDIWIVYSQKYLFNSICGVFSEFSEAETYVKQQTHLTVDDFLIFKPNKSQIL